MSLFPRMTFVLTEGWARLGREGRRTLVVSGIVGAVLLQVALVLLVVRGLDRAFQTVQGRFELTVFMVPKAQPVDRDRVQKLMVSDIRVAAVRVVTKEQALDEFRQDPEVDRMVRALGENPLSDSLTANLKPGGTESLDDLLSRLKADPAVEEVDSGNGEWAAVAHLGHSARILGALWCLLVLLGAWWAVGGTLSLVSRTQRPEAVLLQRLGAPPWALSGPFIWEGILQGLLGALAAGLGVGFLGVLMNFVGSDGLLLELFKPEPSDWILLAWVLAILGGLLGGLGAWGATTRFARPDGHS